MIHANYKAPVERFAYVSQILAKGILRFINQTKQHQEKTCQTPPAGATHVHRRLV